MGLITNTSEVHGTLIGNLWSMYYNTLLILYSKIKNWLITLFTECEKVSLSIWISLFDVCIVDIDSESGMTVLYNISGICPALMSVPLFDFRDDLNVNVILKQKTNDELCKFNYSFLFILLVIILLFITRNTTHAARTAITWWASYSRTCHIPSIRLNKY